MDQMQENNFSDNLFAKAKTEHNVVSSIDGATALKLDENFEIKNSEEQNALIDSFENNEENKISEAALNNDKSHDEIPSGVSIESASYMENNTENVIPSETLQHNKPTNNNTNEEYTPKLFSEDSIEEIADNNEPKEDETKEQLFDQDVNEDEDFEIPAFLRRQKF